MSESVANPLGLDGFEFLEFAAADRGVLEEAFLRMGFVLVANHRSKDVQLWRQGGINFVINHDPHGPAAIFAAEHGPSACGMGFRVKNARAALRAALDRGAEQVTLATGPLEAEIPAIRGIGGSLIQFIECPAVGPSVYEQDFQFLPGVDREPRGAGFVRIDHLTHNVFRGRIGHWEDFYTGIFGFREMRQFDVSGEYSGLNTKVMVAPDNRIRIPLNEDSGQCGPDGRQGQIAEFLEQFRGEGIQHIALASNDLYASLDALHELGMPFAPPPPSAYYDQLGDRLPGHGEPVGQLARRGILVDGSIVDGQPRLLMQVFSRLLVGPVFFEFIQRKGDEGFGEGNITALFRSMEEDQRQRDAGTS